MSVHTDNYIGVQVEDIFLCIVSVFCRCDLPLRKMDSDWLTMFFIITFI